MVSYLFGPLDSVYGHSLENSDYPRWNIKDESYQGILNLGICIYNDHVIGGTI